MKSGRASALLGPEIVEGHELQLMHTAFWGENQPQTLSHYTGTSLVTEEGIRVNSNAEKKSVYLLLVLSHRYLSLLVCVALSLPHSKTPISQQHQ